MGLFRKAAYPKFFLVTFVLGVLLIGIGFALEEYYKTSLADKNGDGVKDWRDVDINGDGCVDIRDVVLIAKNYNQPASVDPRCDINEDGFIDEKDANLASQFFGQHLSILNLYTNQGKVFVTGLILSILSIIGMVARRHT